MLEYDPPAKKRRLWRSLSANRRARLSAFRVQHSGFRVQGSVWEFQKYKYLKANVRSPSAENKP